MAREEPPRKCAVAKLISVVMKIAIPAVTRSETLGAMDGIILDVFILKWSVPVLAFDAGLN